MEYPHKWMQGHVARWLLTDRNPPVSKSHPPQQRLRFVSLIQEHDQKLTVLRLQISVQDHNLRLGSKSSW